MSRKRAAILAAIAAGAAGAAMALPASADHPGEGGYAQTVVGGLSLPDAVSETVNINQAVSADTGRSLRLCVSGTPVCVNEPLAVDEDVSVNQTVTVPLAASNIQLSLDYVLLQNETHLPDVATIAGTEAVTCPPLVPGGETYTAEGISLDVAAGQSDRFTKVEVALIVDGDEMLRQSVPPPSAQTTSPAVSAAVGLC